MYPSIGQIVGFIAVVIVMSGLAIVLNRRIEKRRMAEQEARNQAWVQLDVRRDADEEPSAEIESKTDDHDDERSNEINDQSLQTRAKQNGHYSESKRPG